MKLFGGAGEGGIRVDLSGNRTALKVKLHPGEVPRRGAARGARAEKISERDDDGDAGPLLPREGRGRDEADALRHRLPAGGRADASRDGDRPDAVEGGAGAATEPGGRGHVPARGPAGLRGREGVPLRGRQPVHGRRGGEQDHPAGLRLDGARRRGRGQGCRFLDGKEPDRAEGEARPRERAVRGRHRRGARREGVREDPPENLGPLRRPADGQDEHAAVRGGAAPRDLRAGGKAVPRILGVRTVLHGDRAAPEVTAMPVLGGRAGANLLQERGSSLRYTPLLPPSLSRMATPPAGSRRVATPPGRPAG